MQRRDGDAAPPFDFWTYVDALPSLEFEGHDFSAGEVDCVYVEPRGRYEHVLVACAHQDVFLVIVLDVERGAV